MRSSYPSAAWAPSFFSDGLSRQLPKRACESPSGCLKNRRFSRIGLAGEGDEKGFGLRRSPLPFARGMIRLNEDLGGLAGPRATRFRDLDDGQSAARMEETIFVLRANNPIPASLLIRAGARGR